METENKLFNPASQPKDWLIDNFIVRTKTFERIYQDIASSTMQYPEQNYIIVGERGMGKTTLLLRLKYEVENNTDLNTWLIPIYFSEETYDLTSLSNLWEKLLKYLDETQLPNPPLYNQTDAFVGKPDYEKLCFNLLSDYLKTQQKKILLFMDNFGELFLDNLTEKEQHRLREILINSPDLRIIGSSAVVMEEVYDYSKPFYEFFRVVNLDSLTIAETNLLLAKFMGDSPIIDVEKQKGRIETLHVLTGGNVRTLLFLYEVLIGDSDGSALKDLEIILDRITPLYKSKMEAFSLQQRKIIDVIAKQWDPVPASVIAANIRENGVALTTKLISAQLNQLEKRRVIEKKLIGKKNNLYQLRERFFNIWYLMRSGDRYERNRVIWLTRYLEVIYDFEKGGIDPYLQNITAKLKDGKFLKHTALMLVDAIAQSDKLLPVDKVNFFNDIEEYVDLSSHTNAKTDIEQQLFKDIDAFIKNKEFEQAAALAELVQTRSVNLLLAKGAAFAFARKPEKVHSIIEEVCKTEPENYHEHLGFLYYLIQDYTNAIAEFERAVSILPSTYNLYLDSLEETGNIVYAEKMLLEGLETKKITESRAGTFYYRNNQPDKAIEHLLKNPELDNDLNDLMLLDTIYRDKKELSKTIPILQKALKIRPDEVRIKAIIALDLVVQERMHEAVPVLEKILKSNIDIGIQMNQLLRVGLAMAYYSTNKKKRRDALQLIESIDRSNFEAFALNFCGIYLWNDRFEEAIDILKTVDRLDQDLKNLNENLVLLAVKKQYNRLYDLFTNLRPDLKDIAKPFYAYILFQLKDVYPNEYLTITEPMFEVIGALDKQVKKFEKYK